MDGIWTLAAAGIAFVVTAILGKWLIPFLHKLKYGQTIKEIGPTWHKNKQGTPTMGGIMFIIGIVCAIIICVPLFYSNNSYEGLPAESMLHQTRVYGGLLMALAFGLLGFFDDYIKVVKKRNLGLKARYKILFQFLIGAAYLYSLFLAGESGTTYIPFAGEVNLGVWYWPLALFVILGTVNAVNLTDGIDGLASSVTFFASIAFMIIAANVFTGSISVLAAATAGGCAGFLIWNFHPAKVFMGDTGSLFLGGLVIAMGFGVGMPILILPVGIIYFIEACSDIMQMTYFKVTHGKRIFKMAPIHHHFEMSGWSEVKIVTVFSFITILGGAVAVLASLYG